jgi:hypothetical protein|eukprot:2504881-Prymnesium_polylepis.1
MRAALADVTLSRAQLGMLMLAAIAFGYLCSRPPLPTADGTLQECLAKQQELLAEQQERACRTCASDIMGSYAFWASAAVCGIASIIWLWQRGEPVSCSVCFVAGLYHNSGHGEAGWYFLFAILALLAPLLRSPFNLVYADTDRRIAVQSGEHVLESKNARAIK